MGIQLEGIYPLLQVFDMPRAIALYRDVLGFEVVTSAPPGDDCDWCLLRLGGAELMLNTMYEKPERPAAPDAVRTAAHGDTALFFGCRDLDAAYRHLRDHGIDATPPVLRDYGMRQVSFRDQDGYHICLQWRAE